MEIKTMKSIFTIMIAAVCSLSSMANDLVMDMKFAGKELDAMNRTGKVAGQGFLVLQDFDFNSTLHTGSVYFVEKSTEGLTYSGPIPASIEAINNAGAESSDVGAVIRFEDVSITALGKFKLSDLDEVEVLSLKGYFSYSGIEEAGEGKAMLKLNKVLSFPESEQDGEAVVEDWLLAKGYAPSDG